MIELFRIYPVGGNPWLKMNERQCDFALLREFALHGRQFLPGMRPSRQDNAQEESLKPLGLMG